MRTSLTVVCLTLAVLFSCPASTATPVQGSPDFTAAAATAQKAVDEGTIPSAAVAVAVRGKIIYEAGFGYADKSRQRKADATTPYPIASVSKAIVATALMTLYEKQAIALDAPALGYLDPATFVRPADEPRYSVAQVLTHTSGLPTYATIDWEAAAGHPSNLAGRVATYGFVAWPPGENFEYSNLGYGLLGEIIAARGGTSLARYLDKSVFRPLKMRNSALPEGTGAPPRAAVKYDPAGNPLPPTRNDTPGAGNIYASARDLAHFGIFHLAERPRESNKPLSEATRHLMRTYREPNAAYRYYGGANYGLGWYHRTRQDKAPVVVWHEGGMPGASALLLLLPEQHLVISVLINTNDKNDVAQAVAQQLVNSIDRSLPPLRFDPVEDFLPYAGGAPWEGTWKGELVIDGDTHACSLTFNTNGTLRLDLPTKNPELLAASNELRALTQGDLLIGTAVGTLPARDVAQKKGGYILIRLIRHGDTLKGFFVAYAAPEGLRHLYPFAVTLRRADGR
ncbi:serine hydrolase domain-containing protein [Tahibacter amnicola]|uniref:Beta-lactamase family protein n=1 Tax=Tahibacter amnicola TaxID=2976241 RepID=A0ABY6BKI4_9GAMM|nr:serine hydrolase domain-containing protein [Tahibacter amnicola]UXI70533.1 beta-lactamase family protein [Tahibacter amnicola]